jgi:hypothetical protein
VSHGVPACGITVGQPAAGVAQYHCGGSRIWQTGYPEPPWHPLHQQRVPLEYQQETVESAHTVVSAGGVVGQAAARGGELHAAASGAITSHVLAVQRAVVRQRGRGSSPQLQSATLLEK